MTQPTQLPCAFLALTGLDFNAASHTAASIARETGAVAFVSYWKDRPQGVSELRVATSHDGISTFASVGWLDTRAQRFSPAQPLRFLPGQFGDAVHDVLNAAAEKLPGLLDENAFSRLPVQSLKNVLTDNLATLARDTLAQTA